MVFFSSVCGGLARGGGYVNLWWPLWFYVLIEKHITHTQDAQNTNPTTNAHNSRRTAKDASVFGHGSFAFRSWALNADCVVCVWGFWTQICGEYGADFVCVCVCGRDRCPLCARRRECEQGMCCVWKNAIAVEWMRVQVSMRIANCHWNVNWSEVCGLAVTFNTIRNRT